MSLEIPIAIVDKESRQPAAAHNTTPGGYATAWLNAARNRTLGPNRTQEVQEGDSITLMVEGKYLDIKAGAFRPKDLLQPVEGAPASPLLTDLGQPISVGGVNQFLLFKALHLLITGIQQKPAPEAYLGYALYDADSNLYDQGRIVLSKKARNRHEELKTRIFVPKDGYIEAYVVNESDEDVWFDQFRILSTGPVIVQETHYDPWGVELQGLGYQQGGLKVNKYLYNGKEFNDHLGLNLFDYGARMYDASVGRWFTVDPLEESDVNSSPYNYVFNNPLLFIDPDGRFGDIYNLNGTHIGNDGKNDNKVYLSMNRDDTQLTQSEALTVTNSTNLNLSCVDSNTFNLTDMAGGITHEEFQQFAANVYNEAPHESSNERDKTASAIVNRKETHSLGGTWQKTLDRIMFAKDNHGMKMSPERANPIKGTKITGTKIDAGNVKTENYQDFYNSTPSERNNNNGMKDAVRATISGLVGNDKVNGANEWRGRGQGNGNYFFKERRK